MIGTAAKWGAVLGGAALAVGGAVVALGNKTAASADRIDKMSQKLGLSRQGFQEWEFVLSQSGASIDGLQTGLRTLAQQADLATQGSGRSADAFRRLGVSVRDANGSLKDQERLFNEVILALSSMESETERTAIASQLLGRSATELAPLLNSGADSIDALRQKAHELGLVLDDELIDTGVQWTDTMDQIKRALGSIWMEIANRVMPVFLGWLQWLAVNIPKAGYIFEFLGNVAKIVFEAMAELAGQAWDAVKPLIADAWNWTINTAGTAWEWITETTWQQKLEDVKGWFADAWHWTLDRAGDAWDWVRDHLPGFASAVEAVYGWLKDTWKWTLDTAGTAWEWLTETTWQEKLQDVKGWLKDTWEWIINTAGTAWKWLTGEDALGPVIDKVGDALKDVWDWTINAAGSAWDWLRDTTWSQKVEDLKGWLSDAWDWTVNLVGDAWAWITENLPWVDRAVSRMGNWIAQGWNWVINIAGNAWDWFVSNPVQAIIDLWNDARTAVIDAVKGIYDGVKEWLLDKLEPVLSPIKDTLGWVLEQWEWLQDRLVGHSVIPDMINAIAAQFGLLKQKLAAPVDDVISDVEYKFNQFAEDQEDIAKKIAQIWSGAVQTLGSTLSKWISQTTVDLFAGVMTWQDLISSFGSLAKGVMQQLLDALIQHMIANAAAQQSWLAETLANIATAIAGFIAQAYASLVAFYWWLGPGAPIAAAATIGVVTAAVAKYAGEKLRGLFGGGGGGSPSESEEPMGPEEPGAPGAPGAGGHQVSEITGPTRDLLTDLLSPLAYLGSLMGLGYQALDLAARRNEILEEILESAALPDTAGIIGTSATMDAAGYGFGTELSAQTGLLREIRALLADPAPQPVYPADGASFPVEIEDSGPGMGADELLARVLLAQRRGGFR